jgi:hypothetical protein
MKDFEKGAIYILIQNGNLFVRRRRYGKRWFTTVDSKRNKSDLLMTPQLIALDWGTSNLRANGFDGAFECKRIARLFIWHFDRCIDREC